MSELPSGTVTFLFTDIEGSMRLERQLRERYGEVLGEHQAIVRAAFAAHGGHEIDTQGDSFFYVFPRAKAAVDAAVAAQRALTAHTWPEEGEVRVRMGINTGEASLEDGRYVGFAVHRAARISAAGHGGQILLSSSTRDVVEADLGPGLTVRDLGERRLKDLPRPERVYQLVAEGLPSQFGRLKTLDVELRRKRRRMYAGAALIGAAIAGVALVIALGQGSGGGANVEPNSVAIIDAESNKVVDSVLVGIRPSAVAVGEGSVWVANTEDETVSRIDARSHELIRTIPVGEYPSDLAVIEGAAWVALGGPAQVRRISPERSEAEEPFRALQIQQGTHPGTRPALGSCVRTRAALVAGGGALWLACSQISGSADASRVDPLTKGVIRVEDALFSSSPVPITFSDVAFGFGSVWIVNRAGNFLTQIDARTLRNVREVTVGSAPQAVAVGFGSVWVANEDDDTVSRLAIPGSPEQPPLVESIPIGDRPADVAVGENAVWVVSRGDRTLSRIDPTTNTVVATIRLKNEPVRVAVGNRLVWVTVQERAEG